MKWLTIELKDEIKRIFEDKYDRLLSENEIIDIAESLTQSVEIILKTNE